jgi:hypothetical protein
LHDRVEVAGARLDGEPGRVAQSRGVGGLARPVPLEALNRGFDGRLDANIARRADADVERARIGIDHERAVAMALDEAEGAFLRHERLPVGLLRGLALRGRHLPDGLLHAVPGAHVAELVGHAPDPLLVGDEEVVVPPGEPIRRLEAFGVALDPLGAAIAVTVAQQRQVARHLLGDDHVPVGQNEQPPRILQAGRKGRYGEALRDPRGLSLVGQDERRIADDRPGLRGRQRLRRDVEPLADLLVRERIAPGRFLRRRGL